MNRGSRKAIHQCQMCELPLKCGMEIEPENSFSSVLLWKVVVQASAPCDCGFRWEVFPRGMTPSMLVTPLIIIRNPLGFNEFFRFVGSSKDYNIAAIFFIKTGIGLGFLRYFCFGFSVSVFSLSVFEGFDPLARVSV